MRVAIALLVAALAAVAAAGCGGSSSTPTTTTASHELAGPTVSQSVPVAPLKLKNSVGHPIDINDYRGKAVLVTFIYANCPDVCPLIVGNLHTAQKGLGSEAKKLQIIAVSVDPKGDTPKAVNAFLRDHQMTGRMEYLIGSRPQLEKVWSDWGIVSRGSPKKNNPDFVEHSAEIVGVSASGRVMTLYPANFRPQQIEHDVPILATS
jgi:protein SCO1/2